MEHQSPPRLLVRERSRSPVLGDFPAVCAGEAPSPLRETSFRMLDAECVNPSTPTCKFSPHPDDEMTPGGTLKAEGYCAAIRTVGYATVGGKSFMSGRCPTCKRIVKSADQVCTPNATPPPSPWRAAISSPLRSLSRSPRRSPKTGAPTPTGEASPPRSPIRTRLGSPFRSPPRVGSTKAAESEAPEKGGDEGQKGEVITLNSNPFEEGRRSRSTVRNVNREPLRGSKRTPWDAPSKSKGYDDGDVEPRSVGSRRDEPCRPLSPTVRAFPPPERAKTQGAFFNGPRHAEEPRAPTEGTSSARAKDPMRKSRSLSPVRISTKETVPSPLSPVRSPYKGSFFDQPIEESEASVGRTEIPVSPPHKGRARSRSPFRNPLRSPFSEKGLRSPLRSPFKAPWFSKVPVETE